MGLWLVWLVYLIHEALYSDNVHFWSNPGQQLDTVAWATLEPSKSTG